MILAHCGARYHNTYAASRGTARGRPKPKCICPRAVWISRDYWRAMKTRQHDGLSAMRLSKDIPEPTRGLPPDLRAGVCRRPLAAGVVEDGFNVQLSAAGVARRARAKALCNAGPCPVREQCRAWVLREERPAGSWGGVYGGLDPWNRKGQDVVVSEDKKIELVEYDIT